MKRGQTILLNAGLILALTTGVASAEVLPQQRQGIVDDVDRQTGKVTIDNRAYQIDNEAVWHIDPIQTDSSGLRLIAPNQAMNHLAEGQAVTYVLDERDSNPPRIAEIWITP